MRLTNFLIVVLICLAVVLPALNIYVSIHKFFEREALSGYASSTTGTVNLSIESAASINFSTNAINWGAGRLNSGSSKAILDTGSRNVSGGNWTNVTNGLILENVGSVNVSINLGSTKTASTFIGGTSAQYKWNITNNESGSCVNYSDFALGRLYDVNSSAQVCNPFGNSGSGDEIRIDIHLEIPTDSNTGDLTDTITATATAVA